MTYRDEDDKELLIAFMEWLAEHGWQTEPHEKRMWLVAEYLKEKAEQQAWGKNEQIHRAS